MMEYNYWGGCWSHILIHKARGERHHPLTNVGFDVIFLPPPFQLGGLLHCRSSLGLVLSLSFSSFGTGGLLLFGRLHFAFFLFQLCPFFYHLEWEITFWPSKSTVDKQQFPWSQPKSPSNSHHQSNPLFHCILAIVFHLFIAKVRTVETPAWIEVVMGTTVEGSEGQVWGWERAPAGCLRE